MTRRDATYCALRDAGEEGITRARLRAIVGTTVGPHIESLRHEGLEIADESWHAARGVAWGWKLVRDPWAEQGDDQVDLVQSAAAITAEEEPA